MGRKAYDKCIEVMQRIRSEGYEKEVSAINILKHIKQSIGADIRSTEKYLLLLREFGFIIPKGNGVFEIIEKEIKTKLY